MAGLGIIMFYLHGYARAQNSLRFFYLFLNSALISALTDGAARIFSYQSRDWNPGQYICTRLGPFGRFMTELQHSGKNGKVLIKTTRVSFNLFPVSGWHFSFRERQLGTFSSNGSLDFREKNSITNWQNSFFVFGNNIQVFSVSTLL